MRHPANQGRGLKQLVGYLSWQMQKRIFRQPRDVRYHGLKLRCYPANHSTSRAIHFHEYPDFAEMRFMRDYLRHGDRFIDVGANAGLYTLLASRLVGAEGQVYAFEPMPSELEQLVENISLNALQNIQTCPVAVGDQDTTLEFNATDDGCTGHVKSSVQTDAQGSAQNSSQSHTKVASVRLDTYLPRQDYAMIKLDIEGYEPFALAGAQGLLSSGNPPVIQLEMDGYAKRFGVSTEQLMAQLAALEYGLYVYLPEERKLQVVPKPWAHPADNFLAIHRSRLDWVRERIVESNEVAA